MSNSQCATRIKVVASIILLFSASAIVHADTRIKGQVLHNGRPAANATLSIFCDNGNIPPALTTNYGAFQTLIPRGKTNCKLEVVWNNRKSERVAIDMRSSQVVLSINLRSWKNMWLLEIR